MDKEQEILQRLEELRVEQIKALRELKVSYHKAKSQKVEKAKKKQRRRTTHGYPTSTTTSKEDDVNQGITTPVHNHVVASSSRHYSSSSKIDQSRRKKIITSSLNKKQQSKTTIKTKTSLTVGNCSIPNAGDVNKIEMIKPELEQYKSERVAPKTEITPGNVCFSKESSLNAKERNSKPTASLDLTPKTRFQSIGCKDESKIVFDMVTSLNLPPKKSLLIENKTENTHLCGEEPKNTRLKKAFKISRKSQSWQKSKITKTDSVSTEQTPSAEIKEVENFQEMALGKYLTPLENSSEVNHNKSNHKSSKNSKSTNDKVECTESLQPTFKSSEDGNEGVLSSRPTDPMHNQQFMNFSQNIFSQSLFDDVAEDESKKDDLFDANYDPLITNIKTSTVKVSAVNNKQNHQQVCKETDEMKNSTMTYKGSNDCAESNLTTSCNSVNNMKSFPTNAVQFGGSINILNNTDLLMNETLKDEEKLKMNKNDCIASDYSNASGHEITLLKRQIEKLKPEPITSDCSHMVNIFPNETKVFNDGCKIMTESQSVQNEVNEEGKTVPQELMNLSLNKEEISSNFDELFSLSSSVSSSQNTCHKKHSNLQEDSSVVRQTCLQHSVNSTGSCNEVRGIKFLTLQVGESRLDMIAVCLRRLVVLWKAVNNGTSWIVMHKWLLGKDEEITDMEVTSIGLSIVLIIGGNLHNVLGRIYCVHDKNNCEYDLYEEVSFSDLGEIAYTYKNMCLIPNNGSTENVTVMLASTLEEKIVLKKWTIDLICFCLEDCKDLPEITGDEISSLCLVKGSNCLLLGCVDCVVHLWNYRSCELLCKITLNNSLLAKPVYLDVETNIGIIFLSMLSKEDKKVDMVAVNPQTWRQANLKTLHLVDDLVDERNQLLHCCKEGAFVISSFQNGKILLYNIVTDKKTVLHSSFDDVNCISLHQEDSTIAFGTVSGCVYLNVL